MMRLLVDHGADPKINTEVGVTPLMAAAGLDYYEGESPGPLTGVPEAERLEAVKLALELGNDINAHGAFRRLSDGRATRSTRCSTIRRTWTTCWNLGVGDPRWDGMTALHGAVLSNQPSLVQYLVDHGAQIDVKNSWAGRR